MCLWNTDAPGGNKVKIWHKFLSPTFWPRPTPRGMWCQWSVRNPLMNLQSKFGNCITTQTSVPEKCQFCQFCWWKFQMSDRNQNLVTSECPIQKFKIFYTEQKLVWQKMTQSFMMYLSVRLNVWQVLNVFKKSANFKYCTVFVSGTELQTDGQTNKQTDGRTIRLLDAPADLSGRGHKKLKMLSSLNFELLSTDDDDNDGLWQ